MPIVPTSSILLMAPTNNNRTASVRRSKCSQSRIYRRVAEYYFYRTTIEKFAMRTMALSCVTSPSIFRILLIEEWRQNEPNVALLLFFF
jgi:hypothetical protein